MVAQSWSIRNGHVSTAVPPVWFATDVGCALLQLRGDNLAEPLLGQGDGHVDDVDHLDAEADDAVDPELGVRVAVNRNDNIVPNVPEVFNCYIL